MKTVSIIGVHGVPAKYGGYETLVEYLIRNKKNVDINYVVYCSSKDYEEKLKSYFGASLKYVPLKASGKEAIFYDFICALSAAKKSDVLLSLGAMGGALTLIIKLLNRNVKVIANVDGLDHKREKWGFIQSKIIETIRWLSIKCSDVVVSDNEVVKKYLNKKYLRESILIEYGGDHKSDKVNKKMLDNYGLKEGGYFFKVARIEPENNLSVIMEAFEKMQDEKLVVVGNWMASKFGRELKDKYSAADNIVTVDPLYELSDLDGLRNYCKVYIHGHSKGGTNPSLVEAMCRGLPIFCYDVDFNRCTTENSAMYFSNEKDLFRLVKELSIKQIDIQKNSRSMYEIAQRRYLWSIIASKYESLY